MSANFNSPEASSASGFAALALAAVSALGLDWDLGRVSDLARRSSASAARSLYGGFVSLAAGPAEATLERAHITANKNAIPFDPQKPAITSGIRLGSPAATTRGFGVAEFHEIGLMIGEVLDGLAKSNDGSNEAAEQAEKQAKENK